MTGQDGALYLVDLPHRPGGRRRLPAGQRGGDHHRRLPGQPARHGARDQQHRRRQRACSSGSILGGLLAPIDWRLVFLISVPVGLFGTVWAYLKLEERSKPRPAKIDWWGNVTFALGLVLVMVSVTYGIRPYGGSPTGWGSPRVLALLAGSIASLIAFAVIERRVEEPMFRLPLFRIRAFTFGTLSTFLAAVARGGLMFMLIIWLQGIWLPLHGYGFTETPLWAGIYMLPLTVGMLFAGPISGYLSDRYGARPFATGGMLAAAAQLRDC